MVKKVLLVSAGAALVFALIFGRAGVSYVSTSVSELRQSVRDSVPVEFQLKNARDEIKKLDPEMHKMMREIAKEELDVEKLREECSAVTISGRLVQPWNSPPWKITDSHQCRHRESHPCLPSRQ